MTDFFTIVRITGIHPVSRQPEIIRLTNAADYTADGFIYAPHLKDVFSFKQTLFGSGTTSGDTSIGVGTVTALNNDGEFDAYKFHGFDGQKVEIYHLSAKDELPSEANLGFRGVMFYAAIGWEEVTFYVKNRMEELNVDACKAMFLGTNEGPVGLEGKKDDLKDRPKPMLYGECVNIPWYRVNSSKEIYACNFDKLGNTKAVYAIWNVLDKGGEIFFEADTDVATLIAATVTAGHYQSCRAAGLIKLGTPARGDVTGDVYESMGESSSAPRVVERILRDVMGYVSGVDYDPASLQELHDKNPASVGIYIEDQDQMIDVCTSLLGSIGGYMVPDLAGKFHFGRVELPIPGVTPSVATFDGDVVNSKSLTRLMTGDQGHGIPCQKVELRHTKNWKVVDEGAVLESASAAVKSFISTEYRTATAPGSVTNPVDAELTSRTAAVHKLAPSLSFDTLLVSPRAMKLRNGDFSQRDDLGTPLLWDSVSIPGSTAISVTDGVCTMAGDGANVPELRQNIGIEGAEYTGTSLNDELFKCKITVALNLITNLGDLVIYLLVNGDPVYLPAFGEPGKKSVTLDFNGDPTQGLAVCVSLTNSSESSSFSELSVSHAQYGLSPDQEASRLFQRHGADTERYTLTVPYQWGNHVILGQFVTLKHERFNADDGKLFMVIGREPDVTKEEITFDLYG